jgi:hypothetical protein
MTIVEHQGLEEGEEFAVKIEVIANPQPIITWYIDNLALKEGDIRDIYTAKPVEVIVSKSK